MISFNNLDVSHQRFSISEQDDELQVKVNKLSSTKTQLPYDFYFLDYCKPSKIMNNAENLGEVLRGDRIENSIYVVSTGSYDILMLHNFHNWRPDCNLSFDVFTGFIKITVQPPFHLIFCDLKHSLK